MNILTTTIWEFLFMLLRNQLIKLVIVCVIFDTIFGLARAIKERKFNSCFGIDGALRKILMIISVIALAIVDKLIGFNMLPFVPEEILKHVGLTKLGICEFFCLLYILYEAVSILKNMCLWGLPLPKRARDKLQNWLNTMTGELDEKKEAEEKENENTFNCGSRSR